MTDQLHGRRGAESELGDGDERHAKGAAVVMLQPLTQGTAPPRLTAPAIIGLEVQAAARQSFCRLYS